MQFFTIDYLGLPLILYFTAEQERDVALGKILND